MNDALADKRARALGQRRASIANLAQASGPKNPIVWDDAHDPNFLRKRHCSSVSPDAESASRPGFPRTWRLGPVAAGAPPVLVVADRLAAGRGGPALPDSLRG
jgi:hypothetical protein